MKLSATTIEISTRGLQYQIAFTKPSNPTNPSSYHPVQIMDVCLTTEASPTIPLRQPEGWGERGVFRIVIPSPH
jgi:hypothetical protein